MKDSLFCILSTYKPLETVNPEENFSTELLVYLLKYSLENSTLLFSSFLNFLCLKVDESEYERFSIYTQLVYFTEDGKQVFPDITLETEDELIFIEVKLESGLNYYDIENEENREEAINQIQLYQTIKTLKEKKIYLLTKYFCDLSFENCLSFKKKLRWQDFYYLIKQYKAEDSVEKYLIEEVKKYMEEKNRSIPKVSYEIMNGMESLKKLINQMESALEGIPYKRSFGYEWMGYYLSFNDIPICWVGTYYDGKKLLVQVNNENAIKAIESGTKDEFIWKKYMKKNVTYFDFEEKYYFCLKAEEQLETLKKWIDSVYKKLVEYSGLS